MATAMDYSNKKPLPTRWVPPKKPTFRDNLLEDEETKEAVLAHRKQPYLDRKDTTKLKNSFKKQLCIEMLFDGYQKSFRELDLVLKLQMKDRYRLGAEHPVWEKPLLDQEPDKLSYLCAKLNMGEEAERNHDFKVVHKYYNDLANYFLLTDDIWLSDYFFEKCLKVTSENLGSDDTIVIADSHCNLGLALERQNSYIKACEHFLKFYELTSGKDWKIKLQLEDFNKSDKDRIRAIKSVDVEPGIKELLGERMFKDACIHLSRIYRIIANRFAESEENRLEYLTKAFEVCKTSGIRQLEGQASLILGNAYSDCGRLETAISFYNRYYEISKQEKDLENFGIASEALAKCNEKLGHVNKSIDFLQKYLDEVSNNEADKQYARACSCLANIYNSLGKYDVATNYSKKAFDISRQTGHREATEHNRVLFGIARAHRSLSLFNSNVEESSRKSINKLVRWKYEAAEDCEKILGSSDK